MAHDQFSWFEELNTSEDNAGLEVFGTGVGSQDPKGNDAPKCNALNIAAQSGVHYVTLCLDGASDNDCRNYSKAAQQFCIWMRSLKDTDVVMLSVVQTVPHRCNIEQYITILNALVVTNARVTIMLDSMIMDESAYFFLATDHVEVSAYGTLFIPAYNKLRSEDVSAPFRAAHDFITFLVEKAIERKLLTQDEADTLNTGTSITLDYNALAARAADAGDALCILE